MPVLYPQHSRDYSVLTNGVQTFLKGISTYLVAQHGHAGTFIKLDKHYKVPAPDDSHLPAYDKDDQQSVIAWKLHKEECTETLKLSRKHKEAIPNMYATIFGQLSPESISMLEADVDWHTKNIEEKLDALELVRLSKKTHMATNTGSSPLDMDRARRDFIQMKQQRGETIHSYRLRLEDSVARMKALKCKWIPDEENR